MHQFPPTDEHRSGIPWTQRPCRHRVLQARRTRIQPTNGPSDVRIQRLVLGSGGVPMHLCGQLRAERWNDSVTPCLHLADAAPVQG